MKYIVFYYDRNPLDPQDRLTTKRATLDVATPEIAAEIMFDCGKEVIDVTEDTAYTEMDEVLGVEPATQKEMEGMVELFEAPRFHVSKLWAERHLNVDEIGYDSAMDKAFGKGNWSLGK